MKSNLMTTEYKNWIKELKQQFQSSQIKASIQVNNILLEFYWNLGNGFAFIGREYKLILNEN